MEKTKLDQSVLRLLSLANLDSPFASQLMNQSCIRMTKRMLKSGKIDESTARKLCRNFGVKKSSGAEGYFLVN